MMSQLTQAFTFPLTGQSRTAGRQVFVLTATPRPGYKPPNMARGRTRLRGQAGFLRSGFAVSAGAGSLPRKSVEGEHLVLDRYRAFLKRWPVPNRQLFVPTSQGETFVVISGPENAPALLLLHGVDGRGDFVCTLFSCLLHRHDRRARTKCSRRPALASDAYALWLDNVLNHLAVGRVSILGISPGGWLALDYAIRRPEKVDRVAVLCPGGIGRQKVGIVFATRLSRMFGEWGKRRLMKRILGDAPHDPPPPVKAFLDFAELIQKHFRPRMVKLPVFPDKALHSLNVPLLAIIGARDVLLDSAQTKSRLDAR